jgi:hypothetical protein
MLSNIVFIIILILLIIILGLLYFFSTDIRKNKNKINILESDLNAIRERVISLTEKLNNVENNSYTELRKKGIPGNFADILNQLGNMNNEIFEQEEESEEEESDEEEEESEEEEEESDEEEETDEEEEESNEEESTEEEVSEKEVTEQENIINNDNKSVDNSVEYGINNILNELVKDELSVHLNESDVTENVVVDNINDIDDEPLGKPSKKELSKLDIGTVKLGSDNRTKYVVQLNKGGRKFWKKMN